MTLERSSGVRHIRRHTGVLFWSGYHDHLLAGGAGRNYRRRHYGWAGLPFLAQAAARPARSAGLGGVALGLQPRPRPAHPLLCPAADDRAVLGLAMADLATDPL